MQENTISPQAVQYIADLARLHLAKEEAKNLADQLADILGYIKKLEDIDINDVMPTSHVLPLKNVYREDKIRPSLAQNDALGFSIDQDKGAFKVPPIIE